jgi:hypothetical protein
MGGTFECIGCGRRYRWKPELAGRAVKCACGKAVLVPATEPADDVYDFADGPDPVLPARSSVSAVQPVEGVALPMAKAAGPAGSGGPPLAYAQPRANAVDEYFPDRVKDFQAPLAFLVGGILVEFVAGWIHARGGTRGMTLAMAEVGVGLVVGTALMLVAMRIAAKFRSLSFGAFWTAVLKLSAISVAPGAAITASYVFLRPIPFGFLLSWGLGFCLYFALLGFFFDLDQSDTWYCVWVILAVKVGVAICLALVAPGAVL